MPILSVKEAIELQKAMAEKVILEDDFSPPILIGGMDVSCNLYDPEQMIYAAMVVLDQELKVVEKVTIAEKQPFPYRTGLLAFREAPTLVKAFQQLTVRPDVILVDGQGISHPRGLGIASHIGVLLDIPTIGVAKSILVGELKEELPEKAGSQLPLIWKGSTIAMAYRTKVRSKPVTLWNIARHAQLAHQTASSQSIKELLSLLLLCSRRICKTLFTALVPVEDREGWLSDYPTSGCPTPVSVQCATMQHTHRSYC